MRFLLARCGIAVVLVLAVLASVSAAVKQAPKRTRADVARSTALSDPFSESASAPNAWLPLGNACLTAGTSATPSTSIPACGSQAPQDAAGSGALQLTGAVGNESGAVVSQTPVSTANGLVITFTYSAYGATFAGDGMASVLYDASKPLPPAAGGTGGFLGYAGSGSMPDGYAAIGFDTYGNFSAAFAPEKGGPGFTPETIAVRGLAPNFPYLGGYTNAVGKAASLPFSLDVPSATSRPTNSPTIQEQITPSGGATISIDRHDGNGMLPYTTIALAGANGEPKLPANVYVGFTASTGGATDVHQITNLTVATLGATSIGDAFSETSTPAGAFVSNGGPCLTAGTTATPVTSIPACGSAATQDAPGQGTLQLAGPQTNVAAMVVDATPFSTSNGIDVTFTDYSFDGSTPPGDGIALFLSDASQAMPTRAGNSGGSLGYTTLANAYLGVGLDEYGNFSSAIGGTGGPGQTPETLAIRGTTAGGNAYLGGYTSAGKAASLPFSWAQPSVTSRPASAPTVNVLLTAAGLLTVSVDLHDGRGFVTYYSGTIVGVANQPAVPANVYVGLSAGSGGAFETHQVGGFSVNAAPSTLPGAGFTPASITSLAAWYDASATSTLTLSGTSVLAWADRSGNGNTLKPASAKSPSYAASGIDGLPSISFAGGPYLVGSNASFSTSLFNESSVFIVTNQSSATQSSSVLWSGVPGSNPRWNLRLSESGVSHFDFNNLNAGRLGPKDVPTGPAFWTAVGSVSNAAQFLRKDGNTLSSSTGPGATVSGNYPLAVGATGNSTSGSYFYTGQIGEIVAYNRMLTTAQTQMVEGYLACKWGLQNRLPANHPYRTSCPQGGSPTPIAYPTPAAGALVDPTQLRSSNGQLVFNVTASQNASGNPQLTYNGSAVPPTLRLLPGDTLIVNLSNQLPVPPSGAGYLNDTNLHYHGLHVNPNAPGDDSIDLVAMPGQALHYQIVIPANHPSGLYWYHSHAHGEAERQNLSGMSGALIIDGISQYAPAVSDMPERILIARDVEPSGTALPQANRAQLAAMRWAMMHANATRGRPAMRGMTMGNGIALRGRTNLATRNPYVIVDRNFRKIRRFTADTHCTGAETAVKNWTLNGQTNPSIGIRPGEQQFWRFVNAGSDTYLDLQVDNTTMQILALDGVPLGSVGNAPLTVSHYIVPPASRIEFVVTGPASGATAYLRTNCFDAGASGPAMPATTLAVINPNASLSDALRSHERKALHRTLTRIHSASYIRRYATTNALRQQTLTYSDQNTINGQSYDPSGPAQFYAQSGTMEQWTIVNDSSQVHTFHIHQVHFLVDQIVGGTAIEQSNVGQVLDNVNVPAATANGPGSVTLTMDFTDPLVIGTFLLHCHILSHEDAGMMSKITVGVAPPMSLSSASLTFASATSAAQSVSVVGGLAPFSPSGCGGVANATVNGASVSVSPVAAGSCVLTVADSSGLSASLAITVNGNAAAITLVPNSLSFVSPIAAAQNSSIYGGTPPYGVSGCSGIATASISSATLGVAPAAVGTCTLTVSDSASNTQTLSVTVNSGSSVSPLDNDTFHQNTYRTGWYQAESTLTVGNVGSSSFGLLGTLTAPSGMPAFGKVYAQPLYASGESIGGTTHNLVVIATSTDQVYAFDDATETVVWERNFVSAAGVRNQLSSDTTCNDVNPNVGITGTPVIDRARDTMYVVVPTYESGVFHQRLHAISLQNGSDVVSPVEVSATATLATGGSASTSPEYNFARAALLETDGNIYVSLGSHCDYDSGTTHGWLLAYSAAALAPEGSVINLTDADPGTGYFLGAIWMSGFGPAADSSGNLYFSTGNGPWNGSTDFAMSALKVPGTLSLASSTYFTPINEAAESNSDTDFGSGGVMLVPDGVVSSLPHLMLAGGKDGVKFVLNRDNLGGQQSANAGAVYSASTGGGIWGGPAFFQDTNGNSYVIYGGGQPLETLALSPSTGALSVYASTNPGCLECRDSGSQPIVSSNGTTPGTAVVWALKTPGNSGGNITLYAFNALTMATLYSGVAGPWTVGSGASYIGGALISPTVANGKVYVPTDGGVAVFGI